MKTIQKRIILTLVLILFSLSYPSSCIPRSEGPYTYEDWAVCGLTPWNANSTSVERLYGRGPVIYADAVDPGGKWISQSNADYSFGKVIYGSYGSITLHIIKNQINLPRNIGVGDTYIDILKAYGLTQTDQENYFYGDKDSSSSAQYKDASWSDGFSGTMEKGSGIILKIESADDQNPENIWVCSVIYNLNDNKVTEIIMRCEPK